MSNTVHESALLSQLFLKILLFLPPLNRISGSAGEQGSAVKYPPNSPNGLV